MLKGTRWFLISLALALPATNAMPVFVPSPNASAQDAARGSATAHANPSPQVKRTLQFPIANVIGTLFLVPGDFGGTRDLESVQLVGPAKGTITVDVAKNTLLMLDFNRIALTHPQFLEDASPQGIDAVKVSFRAMLENDINCDKLLEHVPHFRDLVYADLDHSDAKDEQLSHWTNLPKLRCIHAMACHINGSCLKNLSSSHELSTLELDYCPLVQSNLAYLLKFSKLRRLDVAYCGLTAEGLKYIGKCSELVDLSLADNKKIDDVCMKHLVNLKKLAYLHLTKTTVTVSGLKTLAGLPLLALDLPRSSYSQAEMLELHKAFPKARLALDIRDKKAKETMKWVYMTKFKD